jgi:hypothetical protein
LILPHDEILVRCCVVGHRGHVTRLGSADDLHDLSNERPAGADSATANAASTEFHIEGIPHHEILVVDSVERDSAAGCVHLVCEIESVTDENGPYR